MDLSLAADRECELDRQDLESLGNLASFGEYTMFHSRGDRWVHPRMDSYRLHTEQLIHENRFHTEMRMSPDAVSKLIDILAPIIQRVEYNSRSEGPILPEHIVGVGLRTLAGGSLSDIRHIFKMSVAAAYGCFDDFIDGVNTAPELAFRAPQSDEEWYQKHLGFLAKSSHRIMNGTALCIDGYFQRTNMPSLSEVTNQIACSAAKFLRHADVESRAERLPVDELQVFPRNAGDRFDDVSPVAIFAELDSIDCDRRGKCFDGRPVDILSIR